METTYYSLASKENFNKALRHFFSVTEVVGEVETKTNLADAVNELLDEKELHHDQILPMVGAVIKDKFNYSYDSHNLEHTSNDFEQICNETSKWSALDIVLAYHNPADQVFLINPKNINHWERARELTKDYLVVIYVKCVKEDNKKIEKEAIEAIEELLIGKDIFVNKDFIDQTVVPKKPAPKAVANKSQKRNVTPRYAIQVSNELFHNGNVEAWKKIIESYNAKYPDLEVSIIFKGEFIYDINSLFKWGKVKHGDSIFFQVGGEDIKGVSKLQKYLFEGASHRYEQFLKIGVGKVLNLF